MLSFFPVAVLICFLVCWTPYHVQRLLFAIVTKTGAWNSRLFDIQETLHLISGMLYSHICRIHCKVEL